MGIFALLSVIALQAPAAIQTFDPDAHSQTITQCDQLISHPDDPYRVAPGVGRKNADLPAAISACETAIAEDAGNPRLNYQLARAYGYSGMGQKALPYRKKSVEAGYPQSLFVVGFITLLGLNEQPQDTCEGGRLIRASAKAGRLAGQIAFPDYYLEGRFATCDFDVSKAELLTYLKAAQETATGDFYKSMLVRRLADDVEAHDGY
ncbi:hypothetical protein [Parasphingorhabdus sp.]|uniref:hypothetical protein n=1 Tax=Parasphingorhabdus sp. TaxID=2709688 RepID=UPI0032662677